MFFITPSRFALFLLAVVARSAVLTPEQAIKNRAISELTFSPDGSRVVCVVSEPPKGENNETHLWMLDVAKNEFRQITFSNKAESSPRWSPDGRTLAFLSTRDERAQIYTMRMDGGEAGPLTSGKNAVSYFRWSPDGASLAFLAPEPKSDADEKKEKDKDDPKIADREQELRHVWLVEAASKKVRQITHGAWRIDQFEWLSNSQLAAVASNQPKAETWNKALFTISTSDGAFTRFGQPNQPFGGLSISPDRSTLAFVAAHNSGPDPFDLFVQRAASGSPRDLTASIDRRVLSVKWRDNATALVSTAEGFGFGLYQIPLDGKPVRVPLPYAHGDFDVARDGTLAFVAFDFDRLPELFTQTPGADAKQVSHIQQGWDGIHLAAAELLHFKSFDGMPMEGALMKPSASAGTGAKYPLILYVHGGPAGKFSSNYDSWAQLLAAHGYEVLMVNPRGSTGYSEEFLKANHADWGGGDFKDLMAGVDAVLARGETDANRIGIGGWSYGGYMAEWAITQTNRFKAAVSGAGMFDLASEFGTESGPEGDEWYFDTPWEHPERFAHSSPATYIRNARTPTLVLQGENDAIDPVGQSTALYRALKRYGVETELVIYPREPHGPREEKHRSDILARMLDWFDRYLKNDSAAKL